MPEKMGLVFRLIILVAVFSEGSAQLISATDQNGKEILITESLATKCGYTISQDSWGKMTFRISLYSCYVQIQVSCGAGKLNDLESRHDNDTYFTVPVKIEISSRPDMIGAVSYLKNTSCPYYWSPREIICDANYMEVSVRTKIPVIAEGAFRDEPEDWENAFDAAVTGHLSIWQIVFYKSSSQKTTMQIDAALNMGYGINTTDSRTLLRSPYSTTESVAQKVGGVTFSTVRATLFYKQRWFIFLVDHAVACPVDDVVFSPGLITWTIPKNISPLLIGAKIVQSSSYHFGVDLRNMTNEQIRASGYEIADGVGATTVRIPIGADGGYYKSHVVNLEHGVTYNIKPFLENVWMDSAWGVTKYTIIKDITTPFQRVPPVIKNDTVPSTMIFNVTIGTFLPDVQLINVTIGGGVTETVPQVISHGLTIYPINHTNGSVDFVLKVPFLDQQVFKKVNVRILYFNPIIVRNHGGSHCPPCWLVLISGFNLQPIHTRTWCRKPVFHDLVNGMLFTLNVTYGFKIIPYDETFTTSTSIECFIPYPIVEPCGRQGSLLTTTIGNLDPNWNLYIKDILATTDNGLLSSRNQTSSTVMVDAQSSLVMQETAGTGVVTTIPISIKDRTGATVYPVVVVCDSVIPVVCLPEGLIKVTVNKVQNVQNMDMSLLRLRDRTCGPESFDANNAYFSFFASACETTRTFENNWMIYDNEIIYDNSASGKPILIMNVTCNYTTNGTVAVGYSYQDNPTPSAQSAMASLYLILRLSKDIAYTNFYGDVDYPVVKYLTEPLYFEVELLYSSDSRLEIFLDTCWATTSPDMNSSPSWPIVTNSCEYGESYPTNFLKVTTDSRVQFPSHFKRFEVKTFTFMDGDHSYTGAIYFHCDVVICDASNLSSDPVCTGVGSCIPAKQRMVQDQFLEQNSGPPESVMVDEDEEYEVEALMDCRKRRNQIQCLIKWKRYGPDYNSWEPESNIHAERLI
ncbi:uncharacterized protein [Aquarana catesbeiana]|uniref:uncharacterized protein n=1 Tax=Aquarana catesbeiana TaxID=8400 RepID=UPI003CC9DEF3